MCPSPAPPERVVAEVGQAVAEALGRRVVGIYVHGSLVLGDFCPARSDLDLFVVLASAPDETDVTALEPALTTAQERFPDWRGRIEAELVGLPTIKNAADAADAGFGSVRTVLDGHRIARISPGEPLHLLAATTHRLLTWDGVGRYGRAVLGPAASAIMPRFPPETVRWAVLEHVRDWPTWVRQMDPNHVGGQVYSVLTVARAWHVLTIGEQVSKRRAATVMTEQVVAYAELLRWARAWWYHGGDDAPGPPRQVVDFVDEVAMSLP